MGIGGLWDGNEWQDYILRLLRLRFGVELVEIPDKVKGDCGIEAYSRDGCCYQCYAPEGMPSSSERYTKNRDKLSRDVLKFCKNGDELSKLFGTTRVRRWVFLIPVHDNKDLVKHAEKKAEEIRGNSLAYVDSDFAIHVCTDDIFEVERNTLLSKGLKQLSLSLSSPGSGEIDAFTQANSVQIARLENKLHKLSGTKDDQARLKTHLLRYYLKGENALNRLRNYPDVYEQVESCRENRTSYVESQSLISRENSNARLDTTIRSFQEELQTVAPSLTGRDAELLAWAATTGWLLECALDFPDSEK